MCSAALNPQVIDKYIKQESDAGSIISTFPKAVAPTVHINQFGVIPKKHQSGKWRLITDLPYPEDASMNDTIKLELCSLFNITVDEVAARAISVGRNSLLAKIDIKGIYRLLPVFPADHAYLGMCWKERIYVDAMLPLSTKEF